jgi:hypothetical protein
MNNTNNLEKLYRAREMASNANEHTEGYLHALDDVETIFRDTETLTDNELVDHIWQWVCNRQDELRK